MTPDQTTDAQPPGLKVKCDTLLELWKGTGARITERRSYEWKIAFGIWAALLVTMGELIAHSKNLRTVSLHHLAADYQNAGIALAALQLIYLVGFVWFRNKKDSKISIHYEQQLIAELKVPKVPDRFEDSKWRWMRSIPASAVPLFQVGMTAFLAVIVGPAVIHALR